MFEFLFFSAIVIGVIISICKSVHEYQQRQETEKLKHTKPKLYARLKQMEHEKEKMAHDEKRMHHEKVQAGAGVFTAFFSLFK